MVVGACLFVWVRRAHFYWEGVECLFYDVIQENNARMWVKLELLLKPKSLIRTRTPRPGREHENQQILTRCNEALDTTP